MGLSLPMAALHPAAVQQTGPLAVGQIVIHMAVRMEHGRHQQAFAHHVLTIQRIAGGIVGEFQHHGAHHGRAVLVRLHRRAVQVGHQAALEAGELPHHVAAFLIEKPRHPVAAGTVQTAVAGQKAERRPALVHIGGRGLLKAGNIVAPEAEAAVAHAQTGAQGLRHGDVASAVVAAPVNGELLASGGGAAGKQNGFALAPFFLQQVKHHLIVQKGVVVVHMQRIHSVVIGDVPHGDALAEVGLQAVHAHAQNLPQMIAVPCPRVGVGHVQNAHARLPQVGLPYVAVSLFQQIAVLHALPEQGAGLTDIGIDPAAEMKPPVVIALEHPHGIGEGLLVPGEVAPVEALHPEAVEVEHAQGDIPIRHALNEGRGGLFVIVGGKGRGQPQAEAPRGHQGGPSGQGGVAVQHGLGCAAIDHVVNDGLSLGRELHPLHLFTGHFEAHVGGVLHEDTIAPIGHIEGDILVGLLAGGAAVGVPHIDGLAVFHIGGEAFAQTIDALAHVQHQRVAHVGLAGILVQRPAHAAERAAGEHPAVLRHIVHLPVFALLHPGGQLAAGEGDRLVGFFNDGVHRLLVGLEMRGVIPLAREVGHGDADDVLPGRGKGHVQRTAVQRIAPVMDGAAGGQHVQRVGTLFHPNRLCGVLHLEVGTDQPITVGKFHSFQLLYLK